MRGITRAHQRRAAGRGSTCTRRQEQRMEGGQEVEGWRLEGGGRSKGEEKDCSTARPRALFFVGERAVKKGDLSGGATSFFFF